MPLVSGNMLIPLFEGFCKKAQIDGLYIDAEIANHAFKLKVLSTSSSQMKGYMNATNSPEKGEGFLFVYDTPMPLEFWMKNVPFDLDIIFFDKDRNYIEHKKMSAGKDIPDNRLERHRCSQNAQFAVETKAGWCDSNLTKGSQLKF